MTSQTEPLQAAISWLEEGRSVVLATIISTWGSAPCPLGSRLVVREDGHFIGSVSGGCIEGDVITRALEMMDPAEQVEATANVSGLLIDYDVADKNAWQVGLACGGKMSVNLERLSLSHGQWIRDAIARRPLVRALNLEGAGPQNFRLDDEKCISSPVGKAALRAWRTAESTIEEIEGAHWFLHVHLPPVRLIIIGAVHISQSLCALAGVIGYDVILVDPRESFASRERFSAVDLRCQWPEDVLHELELDCRCAVVALTHDPKIDDPALKVALASDCFYIAALGSCKTHSARLERLRTMGIGENKLARIHGPAGLNISASTPEEISVSILAQMIERLRH